MSDFREIERFLILWCRDRGVRTTQERGDQFIAIGEVEEKDDINTRAGMGHWKKFDTLGCYPGTLQLVNLSDLARALADAKVMA